MRCYLLVLELPVSLVTIFEIARCHMRLSCILIDSSDSKLSRMLKMVKVDQGELKLLQLELVAPLLVKKRKKIHRERVEADSGV